MRRRLLFLVAVFATTVALMALQKPLFLLWYRTLAAPYTTAQLLQVVGHGLKLDLTVAGYVTVVPLLVALASLWIRLRGRWWSRILNGYFILTAIAAGAIFALDLGLYGYWGFRLDGSVLIYLAHPAEAAASVEWGEALGLTACFAAYAAVAAVVWCRTVRRTFPDDDQPALRARLTATPVLLLAGGVLFLAIRGGVTTATANISKVYFSSEMFLNHAATNPLFSFLSTAGKQQRYAGEYPFYDEAERARRFERLREADAQPPADTLLRTARPDIVLILLESFGRTIMDEQVDGRPVMPNMQRLRQEGVWFENFYANSFRTDRGEIAVLSGYPAQTRMSIMKLPAKAHTLPALARSLSREGYRTSFTYGGDLNFTNQASYLYATGWERLTEQRDLHLDAPTSKWGYADDVITELFAGEVLAAGECAAADGTPFLAGLLTLSSHEPFDVPGPQRFDNKVLNAMAFTDECVGRMIDRWRGTPLWDNLLVVLVADHGYPYPEGLAYNAPLRHRIPMIWTGGAVAGARTVETYGSQKDLCATLLAQLGIDRSDFDFSRDLFAGDPADHFAYYVFNEGFGVADATGTTVYDCTLHDTVEAWTDTAGADRERQLAAGKTLLQSTYVDIDRR